MTIDNDHTQQLVLLVRIRLKNEAFSVCSLADTNGTLIRILLQLKRNGTSFVAIPSIIFLLLKMSRLKPFVVCLVFIGFMKNSNAFSANRGVVRESVESTGSLSSHFSLSADHYHWLRKLLINEELSTGFGSEIILNEQEELANEIVMKAKEAEYDDSIKHPERFIPSRHIFEQLDEIKKSKLFQIIRKMPKGAILHAHST